MDNESLAVKLAETDSRARSNTRRIDKLEQDHTALNNLTSSVSVLTQEQEHMKEDVSEIKTDVKFLAEKPAKRWDGMVEKCIWAVVGGVIVYMLSRIGI